MVTVIFPAAGLGSRMGAGYNKVFMELEGIPVLLRSLLKFSKCPLVQELIIAVGKEEKDLMEALLSTIQGLKPWKVVLGGSERQYSVANALAMVDKDSQVVLVHDGARPLISEDIIGETIKAAYEYGAAIVGVPAKNTIKRCDAKGMVLETPPRASLWEIQTPQGFKRDTLTKAMAFAQEKGFLGTDDASLVEYMGSPVYVVSGDYKNIKLTTPEDMLIASALLKQDKDEIILQERLKNGDFLQAKEILAGIARESKE